MFLAQDKIKELISADPPLFAEGTYDLSCVNQASYDLRLGCEAYLVGSDAPVRLSIDEEYLTIAPGEFAILTTEEQIDVPRNIVGFISLRNRFKMEGLTNISGFHVDPTFKGNLIFAVNNAGPSDVRLRYRQPTFTIIFAEAKGEIGPPRPEQAKPLKGIPLEFVQTLGGSSVTIIKLKKDIDELRTRMLIYAPLAVAALIALIVSLVRH